MSSQQLKTYNVDTRSPRRSFSPPRLRASQEGKSSSTSTKTTPESDFYYYIVDLQNVKDNILPETDQYVDTQEFAAFDDVKLRTFATKQKIPSFREALRRVFTCFIDIEHSVTRDVCGEENKNSHPDRSFQTKYYNSASMCHDVKKAEKCESLATLHDEDDAFIYARRDDFLDNLLELGQEDSKYLQVLILLDKNKHYLGHIYMWSWLTMGMSYTHLYKLEFGGIRTSLQNLLCPVVKDLAPVFIGIIADWALSHGWTHMHIALMPIGPMPGYMQKCGLNVNRIGKIKDIKCRRNVTTFNLNPETDMFQGKDFNKWYEDRRDIDDYLIRSMWMGYPIASALHKLYKMSYPNRTPTVHELEYMYLLTFRTNSIGYTPKQSKLVFGFDKVVEYADGTPLMGTIKEYNQLILISKELGPDSKFFKFYDPKSIEGFKDRCIEEVKTKLAEVNTIYSQLESKIPELKQDYEDEIELYNILLMDFFQLKIRFRNFITWYTDYIFTDSFKQNYNQEIIESLIVNIRAGFRIVGKESKMLVMGEGVSNHLGLTEIYNRIIFLP